MPYINVHHGRDIHYYSKVVPLVVVQPSRAFPKVANSGKNDPDPNYCLSQGTHILG